MRSSRANPRRNRTPRIYVANLAAYNAGSLGGGSLGCFTARAGPGGTIPCPHGGGVALGPTTRMPRAGCVGADGLLHALPSVTKRATARGGFDELELTGTREDRTRELAARIEARRLPTPTATDWKGGGVGGAWHRNLKQGLGGMPSPAFLEWVMGFPIGWTNV